MMRIKKHESNRINPDRQSGSDELGSTPITSDREKNNNIKLKKIETFTHFKVKIAVENGPN